jgi:hypothetical protein
VDVNDREYWPMTNGAVSVDGVIVQRLGRFWSLEAVSGHEIFPVADFPVAAAAAFWMMMSDDYCQK